MDITETDGGKCREEQKDKKTKRQTDRQSQ